MFRCASLRVWVTAATVVGAFLLGAPQRIPAQSELLVTVTYTGSLGPVSSERPLCLCVYFDPSLEQQLGCVIATVNGTPFQFPIEANDYYLIAFLDPNLDEKANPGEPYVIYRNRAAPPADPVTPAPAPPNVDMTFGDENLTPPPTPSETPTETPTPSATPTPIPCAGDCDGSGAVTVDEILILVNIAIGNTPLDVCLGADTDGSHAIEINEIVAAVNNALFGCPE